MTPTPQERRRLAAVAIMPERTVVRAYRDPSSVKPSTLARLERAAIAVGVEPPPPPPPLKAA